VVRISLRCLISVMRKPNRWIVKASVFLLSSSVVSWGQAPVVPATTPELYFWIDHSKQLFSLGEPVVIVLQLYSRSEQSILVSRLAVDPNEILLARTTRERTHYHLIYATRHHKGVQVFKDAERHASGLMAYVRADAQQRHRINSTGQDELFLVQEHGAGDDEYILLRIQDQFCSSSFLPKSSGSGKFKPGCSDTAESTSSGLAAWDVLGMPGFLS